MEKDKKKYWVELVWGDKYEKTFANQESFKEAMIAAELYKTSKTISRFLLPNFSFKLISYPAYCELNLSTFKL